MDTQIDEATSPRGALRALAITVSLLAAASSSCRGDLAGDPDARPIDAGGPDTGPAPGTAEDRALRLVEEGRQIFRFDTFGSEQFWGGRLRLHESVAALSPAEVLGLGLKVDVEALPAELIADLEAGTVDLGDPAITVALLQLDAVVGVSGFFEGDELVSLGIQCTLCHATVDDSFAPGIGRRRDGWPARDLDVGAIIASAPDLTAFTEILGVDEETVREVLLAWGPGRFDPVLLLDGRGFAPDGSTAAVLLPPAFGMTGVSLHTYTGWGSVPYWNAFVAVLQMQGQGTFYDPRLDDAERFPVAAAAGFSDVRAAEDRVSPKLPALHVYQLSLPIPDPPAGSFDPEAAARGQILFAGQADCARCHVPPLFTEPGQNLHSPEEIGIDDFQASRSPTGMYRTTPLRGLFTREQGGFYHDGRFADLFAVVDHYDATLGLGLSEAQRSDLVQYLRSL
jgi:hypothetical protein